MATGVQSEQDHQAYAVTYSNGTWGKPVLMDSNGTITSISCPTTTFCAAVSQSYGDAVTYSNGTWGKPVRVDASNGLDSVSCPSSTFCVADDLAHDAVTYSNGIWGKLVQFEGGLDCSAGDCGGDALNDGSVSCATTTFCVAFDGSDGVAWTYSNGTFRSPVEVVPGFTMNSVSCPSSTFCVAVGDGDYAVTYSNGAWGKPVDVDNSDAVPHSGLFSVSCASSAFCVAVGVQAEGGQTYQSYTVTYSNGTWGKRVDAGGEGAPVFSVSCPSSTFCAATDSQSELLTYPKGG
jgi:hypothetical protein